MFPFLKSVARWISRHYPTDTDKLVIVLPTQRSGHFLKHYLTQFYPHAIWAPEMTTINDWVISGTSGRMAESTELLVELYQVYQKHTKSPTLFEEFMQWGDMILQDFDEVDKNLIPARQLFQNMIDLQSIQDDLSYLTDAQIAAIKQFHQNFSTVSDSELKRKISGLWELFPLMYADFTLNLTQKNLFYEGLAYKAFADSVELHLQEDKTYLFIGFNALYVSEIKILKAARKKGNARFFWDYDHYYLDDTDHEAGRFMRQQMALFPAPDDFLDDEDESLSPEKNFRSLLNPDKQIHTYHLSSLVGQTNLAGQLIAGQLDDYKNEPDYLAVVLPDESLLPALLNQLPQAVESFNISMGYPLKTTQAAILINQLGQVLKLMRVKEDGSFAAYKPALTEFLSHDYLIPFSREILSSFSKSSRQYISSKHLGSLPEEVLSVLIPATTGPEQLESILKFLDWLILSSLPALPEQEKEFSYQVSRIVRSMQNLLVPIQDEIRPETVFRLINKLLRKEKIPFRGEPLTGIQLIGLLETRLLDFRKLIFLSVNEGYFPPSGNNPSFIPYSLRTGFQLMTRDYRDAIYAYYFYRAIQRAGQVHLLIPDGTEAGSRTEASRYLAQMQYSDAFDLKQHLTGHAIRFVEKSPIILSKNTSQLQSFHYQKNQQNRKLSPTALNAYIDCSLRFYFKYILKLAPELDKSENIDAMEFGNIIHDCMCQIYSQEKNIVPEYPGRLRKDEHALRELLLKAFERNQYAEHGTIDVPENKLIFENMLVYLKELLKADEAYAPFTILAVEENIEKVLIINDKEPFSVLMGGQVDRIDQKNGIIRIIDYKTGKDDNHFKALEDLFQGKKVRQKAILQAFLYAEAYLEQHPEAARIEGHILNLKKSFNHDFDSCIQQDNQAVNYHGIRNDFMQHIQTLIEEIFNPAIAFEQTEDTGKCIYCDFAGICKR